MLVKVRSQKYYSQKRRSDLAAQNMIQGRLVNGSIGKVTGFLPTREALQRGIKLGLAEGTPRNKPPSHMGPKIKPIDQPDVEVPVSLLNSPQLWPVVKFNHGSLYGGPIEVLCVPDRFEVNNADGGVEATREQVSRNFHTTHSSAEPPARCR